MTREEFLRWSEGREGRYEFADGESKAMTGGSLNHNVIAGNLFAALQMRLRGGPCRAFIADAGVATARSNVRYPDVLVTCARFDGRERLAPEPVLVCEVASESTAGTDRVAKLREYHAVPSIRRYLLVEQTAVAISAFFRSSDGDHAWSVVSVEAGEVLALPELAWSCR